MYKNEDRVRFKSVGREYEMKVKILAFADFPSPYRVEVFKGLARVYDMFVIFDKMSDQNRNAEWFCRDTGLNSISLLEESGRLRFTKELKQIKKYDLEGSGHQAPLTNCEQKVE